MSELNNVIRDANDKKSVNTMQTFDSEISEH